MSTAPETADKQPKRYYVYIEREYEVHADSPEEAEKRAKHRDQFAPAIPTVHVEERS